MAKMVDADKLKAWLDEELACRSHGDEYMDGENAAYERVRFKVDKLAVEARVTPGTHDVADFYPEDDEDNDGHA